MTEVEWLACDYPHTLAKFCRGQADPERFCWLALDWGERIRHIFEEDDRRYFDAFAAWMTGAGEHPDQLVPEAQFVPLFSGVLYAQYAALSIKALRGNDPLTASAFAAVSIAEYRPRRVNEPMDATKTHRPRSVAKRVLLEAERNAEHRQQRAKWVEHRDRTHREFCEQFRCVAGNPFRPVAFSPGWRSETVVALASGIDAERAFDRMPILADALEEAGCDHADVLTHCRGAGPHVRGCWVVDGVLGKS